MLGVLQICCLYKLTTTCLCEAESLFKTIIVSIDRSLSKHQNNCKIFLFSAFFFDISLGQNYLSFTDSVESFF